MSEFEVKTRKFNIDYIRKQLRTKGAKAANWPGAPLSHFEVTGPMADVLRAQLADGTLKLVERPKPSGYTASFVCLP